MRRQLLACLFLLALVLIAYRGVGNHGFLPARDPETFAEPYLMEGLSWKGIEHSFADRSGMAWQPLTRLSLMLDVELQGKRPLGFHRTNLLLHSLNVILLFLLFRRVVGQSWAPFWCAALLACHPIHVEAVAWISVRGILLGSAFSLLTLHAYERYCKAGNLSAYFLTLVFFALALLSSGWFWPLFLLLLVLDLWPLRRSNVTGARLVLEKLPLLFVALVVVAIAAGDSGNVVGAGRIADLPFAARITRALGVYTTYVCRLVWPVGLIPYYGDLMQSRNLGRTVESGLFLLVITWFAIRDIKRLPFLLVGWVWFLLMLLPVTGIFATYGELLADRYAYFPFIGLYIVVCWSLCEIYARLSEGKRLALGLATGLCFVLLLTLTHWQYALWSSGKNLFTYVLKIAPKNAKGHQYLGLSQVQEEGRRLKDSGIGHLAEAATLSPGDVHILNDFALVLMNDGQLREARDQLMAAFALNPNVAVTYLNLGRLERISGSIAAAVQHLETALKLDDDLTTARLELGVCLAEQRRFPEAAQQFQMALDQRDDYIVREQFGRILMRAGDFDGALQQFKVAGDMHPRSVDVRCDIAQVHALRGNYQEAEAVYLSALSIDPNLAEAHRSLAVLLALMGRLKEANHHFQVAQKLAPIDSVTAQRFNELVISQLDAAIAHYRQFVKLHPEDAVAHGNLARHLAARRENQEAIKHLRLALELKPDWLDGANNLAWMLATLSSPELRDGKEAVKWATLVCERTEHANVEYLDTLAAAYAEAGDFAEATRIAETALQMAKVSGQQELAAMVESRVRLYRNRQPYREESTQTDLPQSSARIEPSSK